MMSAVIVLDRNLFEVHGLPGITFEPSDYGKVDLEMRPLYAVISYDIAFTRVNADVDRSPVGGGSRCRTA